MNQRQISYFLEVYKEKSMTKAAANLFITPQGLSKTVATLEKELNIILFERKGNRISPTKEADKLSIHAKNLLTEYDMIEKKLFLNRNTVKCLPIYCSYDVPQLIPTDFFISFCQKYPNIKIELKEFPDNYISDAIEKNKIELGIIPGPFNPNILDSKPLWTEPFCLVINNANPLSNKKMVSLLDLDGLPLVVKDSNTQTSINQINSFMEKGISPQILLETTDAHLIHQMADDNYAAGISLLYLAKKHISKKTSILMFEDRSFSKTLHIVSNHNNILSFEANAFFTEICDYFNNLGT